jgi:hypothetical protein
VKTDVVGTWDYSWSTPKCTARIVFTADGSFHQTVTLADSAEIMARDGSWDLTDGRVQLDRPLVYTAGRWEPYLISWGLEPGSAGRDKLSIYGGVIPDPDSYIEFHKANK